MKELFKDCGSEIVCREVKKEMSQNRSLRNTVSQTLKFALFVKGSKGKILVLGSMIIVYLKEFYLEEYLEDHVLILKKSAACR